MAWRHASVRTMSRLAEDWKNELKLMYSPDFSSGKALAITRSKQETCHPQLREILAEFASFRPAGWRDFAGLTPWSHPSRAGCPASARCGLPAVRRWPKSVVRMALPPLAREFERFSDSVLVIFPLHRHYVFVQGIDGSVIIRWGPLGPVMLGESTGFTHRAGGGLKASALRGSAQASGCLPQSALFFRRAFPWRQRRVFPDGVTGLAISTRRSARRNFQTGSNTKVALTPSTRE